MNTHNITHYWDSHATVIFDSYGIVETKPHPKPIPKPSPTIREP